MIVERLGLRDYRNYTEAELALQAGPNVLVGSNGQGKTNLAEAIAYLATLGSHRVPTDAPLVREGQDVAVIRALLAHGERKITVEVQINRQGSNRHRVGGSPVKPAELPRYVHAVLFAPEDLQIVRGDPAARRRFSDQLLVQLIPRMSAVLADYDRVLRQRNALLKSARASGVRGDQLATLDVWDDKLIVLGSEIIAERRRLADEVAAPLAAAYSTIAGADHEPHLEWILSFDDDDPGRSADVDDRGGVREEKTRIEARFRAALAAQRSAELERAVTLVGPHRDDLLLKIRGLPVRGYASHGESWSVALALRIASAELLRADSASGDPILILDDVFAELDAQRRTRLAGLAVQYEQVIVTAAVEQDVPERLSGSLVRIDNGRILADAGTGVRSVPAGADDE